jgi:hypothetical protein
MGELGHEDLDPKLLLWDMHRSVDHGAVPKSGAVVHFVFPDVRGTGREWWLVISDGSVDVCDDDPGKPLAATLTSSLRVLVDVWRGERSWADAVRSGALAVDGPTSTRRALPTWFTLSVFANVPRPRPDSQEETSLVPSLAHASAPNTTT